MTQSLLRLSLVTFLFFNWKQRLISDLTNLGWEAFFFPLDVLYFQRHSAVLVLKFLLFCVKLGQLLKTLLENKQIMSLVTINFFCLVRKSKFSPLSSGSCQQKMFGFNLHQKVSQKPGVTSKRRVKKQIKNGNKRSSPITVQIPSFAKD